MLAKRLLFRRDGSLPVGNVETSARFLKTNTLIGQLKSLAQKLPLVSRCEQPLISRTRPPYINLNFLFE
jgi:hypothetical protein